MKKSHNLLIIILFCLFLGGLGLASVLMPDKRFSEMENRNLRPLPELTVNKVTSGRFMTEAESYASDQVVLRDAWVAIKALGEVLSGKQENNGIYFAREDTLIRRVEEPEMDLVEGNIRKALIALTGFCLAAMNLGFEGLFQRRCGKMGAVVAKVKGGFLPDFVGFLCVDIHQSAVEIKNEIGVHMSS